MLVKPHPPPAHPPTHSHTCTHTYRLIHTHIYTHSHILAHIQTYPYTHRYTHTHTYTYSLAPHPLPPQTKEADRGPVWNIGESRRGREGHGGGLGAEGDVSGRSWDCSCQRSRWVRYIGDTVQCRCGDGEQGLAGHEAEQPTV